MMAWNCAGRFHRKTKQITTAAPDIAILSEVPENCAALVSEDASGVWTGSNPNYGLAVIGMNGWQIERVSIAVEERLFLPVRAFRGREEFYIVGVCAKRDGDYVSPTLRALSTLSDFIVDNCAIVGGDFNQSAKFDANRSPDGRFARVLTLTSQLGLASAWHSFHCERFGQEKLPTYFHRWKQDQAFHIDYMFVPRLVPVSSVELGTYEEFTETRLSDHMPLSVEVLISAQKQPSV